ncbi:MAG: transposase [Bacteroidales bacterium]|nr:transposase [Bacteroidales bacterium]MCD8395465.1 transposase [Bacteroidales bacterium]
MSHVVNIQHIVYRTKYSQKVIPDCSKRMMFKYIFALCNDHGWYIKRINAAENHVHLLVNIGNEKPSVVAQKVKSNSSRVFKQHTLFPHFIGWAKRYGSFSVSYELLDQKINYIKNQEEHHRTESFEQEMHRLFQENG